MIAVARPRRGFTVAELLAVVAVIVGGYFLLTSVFGCGSKKDDFDHLRGVLNGEWQAEKKRHDGDLTLDFTDKSVTYKARWTTEVAKYDFASDLLTITDKRGERAVYGVEFLSGGEIALRPEGKRSANYFSDLEGRYKRISAPAGIGPSKANVGAPPPPPSVPVDPVASAKQQVERIEQKLAKVENVHKRALADRDELADKLRSVGVNSTADLKDNIRGQRLAENAVALAGEIDGLERHLSVIDGELLKAKSIVRRIEVEQAGLTADEIANLATQLREAEARTDGGVQPPVTPVAVDLAVEKALKGRKKPK